jgi:hypothetical protein
LCKLAESKGYRLVSMTDTNCFFVIEEEFNPFMEYSTSLEDLKIDKYLTYLYSGYNGDFVFSQKPVYGFRKPSKLAFQGEYFYQKLASENISISQWLYSLIVKK